MPSDERNRTIDGAGGGGHCGIGNAQQRTEHEGRQRLAGTKQSVCGAVEASVGCLLCSEISRGLRSELRSRFHEHAAAAAVNKKTRRSTRTIDREVQNRRTGHRYPSSDAVVTGPCAIAVLQAENLLRDVRMPFRPGVAADALHAVADVEIGEELLAAHRPESTDEGCIGELTLNRADLLGVLRALSAVRLNCSSLRTLIQRDACGFGGAAKRRPRLPKAKPSPAAEPRAAGALRAHRVVLGTLKTAASTATPLFEPEEAARGQRGAEHRRPAASNVPASVRLLMLLDLRDRLLQRLADPSVQRRVDARPSICDISIDERNVSMYGPSFAGSVCPGDR